MPKNVRTDQSDSPRIQKRVIESAGAAELYLTVTPSPDGDLETQARSVYTAIRDELHASGARLFCERLFATKDAIATVEAVRQEVYGELDDGVPPTRVVVSPGPEGCFPGAQVHAIRSLQPPEVMRCCGQEDGTAARVLNYNGHKWLFVNGLNAAGDVANGDVDAGEQARRVFYCTGCFLRQSGATMKSVARTWLWLKDICDWYDQLNTTRTKFFKVEGLIDPETNTRHLPASTGIGLYGANGAACTLDLIALPGREDEIKLVEAGGDQDSAFEYGSAFSRASVAPMPGGSTVFISGTAAIDEEGATEHVGQIRSQVDNTIAHIRSLLKDLDCSDAHVLTALVYCKDAEVESTFLKRWSDLAWPCITMIGDVCRPELLFEVEVTASPDLKVQSAESCASTEPNPGPTAN